MPRRTSLVMKMNLPKHTPLLACAAFASMLMFVVPPKTYAAESIPARDLALAHDYVFAACVIDRYPGTQLASEAEAWAGGLVERGHIAAEAYPALMQWAHTAPEPGTTRNGLAMRLQSCLDFVNARGFDDRLKSLLRNITK